MSRPLSGHIYILFFPSHYGFLDNVYVIEDNFYGHHKQREAQAGTDDIIIYLSVSAVKFSDGPFL